MSDEAAVQAHVTVAYGDSVHTCAAAVNAVNLGRIDPRRRRIAFGWALSADARAILSHGWEVREVREPLGGTPARKAVILDARVHANKRAMLSRAMYWDTDHFPLLSGVRHIEQLWAVNPEASMVASREPGSREPCFSGGLLLFQPSGKRHSEYERLIALGPLGAPHHCAHQIPGHDDQRYINEAFVPASAAAAQGWNQTDYQPLQFETWAVRTPWSFLGRTSGLGPRLDCQRTAESLERLADSYHFYGRMPPWGGNCAECVLRGLPCNVELARRGRVKRPTCAYFAAQALWWAAFARLPARLRNLCYERLKNTSSIEAGGRAKRGNRGIGTGLLAGCNLTEASRLSDADEFDWSPWKR